MARRQHPSIEGKEGDKWLIGLPYRETITRRRDVKEERERQRKEDIKRTKRLFLQERESCYLATGDTLRSMRQREGEQREKKSQLVDEELQDRRNGKED